MSRHHSRRCCGKLFLLHFPHYNTVESTINMHSFEICCCFKCLQPRNGGRRSRSSSAQLIKRSVRSKQFKNFKLSALEFADFSLLVSLVNLPWTFPNTKYRFDEAAETEKSQAWPQWASHWNILRKIKVLKRWWNKLGCRPAWSGLLSRQCSHREYRNKPHICSWVFL